MLTENKRNYKENKVQRQLGVFFRHFVLIIWCSTTLFPLLWTLNSAFRNNTQIFGNTLGLPNPVIWGNIPDVITRVDMFTTGGNSLIYAAVTVALVILLATPVAFYGAKIAKKPLITLYFALGIFIPGQALLIPLFIDVRSFDLMNSRSGIILVYVVTNLAFSIFVLTAFMKTAIPTEVVEASIIDGCGLYGAFWHVVLPLARTGIATAVTFVFLGVWNEFLFALVMLPSPALRTLNLATLSLRGQFTSDQGLISAGVIALVTPAIVIYTLFQEQVVKGLTSGAVKG